MADLWTPEQELEALDLGDLATMDYADLLASLQKDLQLNLALDTEPKTLTQDNLAPQRYAIVQSATENLANNAGTVLASWSIQSSNQYAAASAAGIKTLIPGMYLLVMGLRWSIGTGQFFGAITIDSSLYGNDFFSGGACGAEGFGAHQTAILIANGGETVSAETFQDSGAVHPLENSHILAYYLGPWK